MFLILDQERCVILEIVHLFRTLEETKDETKTDLSDTYYLGASIMRFR